MTFNTINWNKKFLNFRSFSYEFPITLHFE